MKSMTGYGKGEAQGELMNVTVELKSVNHRYKDFRFKMPSALAPSELEFKKLLQNNILRGSVDVFVNYEKTNSLGKLSNIDHEKVKLYLNEISALVKSESVKLSVSPTDFLRSEFYKDKDDSETEELKNLVLNGLTIAIQNLIKARSEEGEKLKSIIKDHFNLYEVSVENIKKNSLKFREYLENKLIEKFNQYNEKIDVDRGRYLQEVIYYLEKLDINEELDRIDSHLKKVKKLIESKDEVGRKLEFFLQELGRETNTIGSKSSMEEISTNIVQMKSYLEKVREQALNIE